MPEPKQAKHRVHLDLFDPDPAAWTGWSAKARRSSPNTPSANTGVMPDPEGDEFCVPASSFEG